LHSCSVSDRIVSTACSIEEVDVTNGANNPVSPKVAAGAVGVALATLIWFVIAIAGILPDDVSPEAVAGATGATGTILSFILGYLVPDPKRG
jgi:hypothetical protein